MKKLIIFILALTLSIAVEAKPKENLPFARKGKYGKLRTKQVKPVKEKQAWIYKQWGR